MLSILCICLFIGTIIFAATWDQEDDPAPIIVAVSVPPLVFMIGAMILSYDQPSGESPFVMTSPVDGLTYLCERPEYEVDTSWLWPGTTTMVFDPDDAKAKCVVTP